MSSYPSTVVFTSISETPISITEHEDLAAHEHMGAVVSFCGVVRNHDGGEQVDKLFYEGHPHAPEVLAKIAQDIAGEFDGVRIAISHRVGMLAIGDVALTAAVASAHRAEGFAACAELVERVKKELPIWKNQYFSDGRTEWVGSL